MVFCERLAIVVGGFAFACGIAELAHFFIIAQNIP